MPDPRLPVQIARQIVARPETCFEHPAVLASMWATMIEARGGTFHEERLGPPAHRVVPDVVSPIYHDADQPERITAKVRDIKRSRGILIPPRDRVMA